MHTHFFLLSVMALSVQNGQCTTYADMKLPKLSQEKTVVLLSFLFGRTSTTCQTFSHIRVDTIFWHNPFTSSERRITALGLRRRTWLCDALEHADIPSGPHSCAVNMCDVVMREKNSQHVNSCHIPFKSTSLHFRIHRSMSV